MVPFMRITLLTLSSLALLVAMGCQQPNPDTKPKAEPQASATQEAVKADEASPVAQASTQVERAFRMTKHPFKSAAVKITEAQLDAIVASGYEAYDTTGEDKVRVFVFHYDAKELVKPAKVARWINESGLIHNGQTSANRLRVVVAGTPVAGELEESTTRVMNDFMDAFMVMR